MATAVGAYRWGSHGLTPTSTLRGPDQKPEKSLEWTISSRRPSGPRKAMNRTPARIAIQNATSARREGVIGANASARRSARGPVGLAPGLGRARGRSAGAVAALFAAAAPRPFRGGPPPLRGPPPG